MTSEFIIPLSRPTVTEAQLQAALDVLKSGNYILGENVKRFEEEFAKFCGTRYAVAVSSGTSALHLALLALGIGPGDEVITTPFTFIATANAIVMTGATPVFVDIEPETLTIDPSKIDAAITPKTKAIIPVHLYGHPADIKEISKIAKKRSLKVIEDACQAHAAEAEGKKIGALGDIGCFSFYPSKNMTVCGDGGMITTDDATLAEKMRRLRDVGRKDKYTHDMFGYNYRLSEVSAAIGLEQLKDLPEWTEKRRALARAYAMHLKEVDGIGLPKEKAGARHVYHMFVIRSAKRDELAEFLKGRGIQTGIHYPTPVHLQPAYSHLKIKPGTFQVSEQASKEVISLPLFPSMTEEQVKTVCDAIAEFHKS